MHVVIKAKRTTYKIRGHSEIQIFKNVFVEYSQIMLRDMSHQVDPYLWSPCQFARVLSLRQKCDMSNINFNSSVKSWLISELLAVSHSCNVTLAC